MKNKKTKIERNVKENQEDPKKESIKFKYRYRCYCCDKSFETHKEGLIIHHTHPKRDYPEKEKDTSLQVPLCEKCHSFSHTEDYKALTDLGTKIKEVIIDENAIKETLICRRLEKLSEFFPNTQD